MKYVCDASAGQPGFEIKTEAKAVSESDLMRHAVEKFFRKEQEKATQTYQPISKVSFEQEIGLKAHIQREMPLFLTLRDDEGNPLATAMLPPGGNDDRNFRPIIVGMANADPISSMPTRSRPSAEHFGITLDRGGATRTAAIDRRPNPPRRRRFKRPRAAASSCCRPPAVLVDQPSALAPGS